MRTLILLSLVLVCIGLAPGCGSSDPVEGGAGEPCYPNDTCDGDLACISGVCVDLTEDCGDGTCDAHESAETCPEDCGEPACGDGVIAGSEVCDGTDLGGETCETQGFDSGELACEPDCSALDDSDCTNDDPCGNGAIDTGEVCDGAELGGQTCETRGYDVGELACQTDCSAFDESDCDDEPCGNSTLDVGEVCDGAELDGETCETQGLGPGILACAADCASFDATGCSPCATCDDWWYSCSVLNDCYPDYTYCAGPSADAYNTLMTCLCSPVDANCMTVCPYLCTGVGVPADDQTQACTTCLSGGLSVTCSTELNNCTAN